MIRLFELELLSAIENQWKTLIANIGTPNDLIPDIFGDLPADGVWGVNQKAISETFKAMADQNGADNLKFVLQYPAKNASFPCIDIEIGAEQEDTPVGEYVDEGTDDSGNFERSEGATFSKQYAIGVFTTNPTATLFLYSFVKYCVLLLRESFQDVSIAITSGRPIQQDFQTFAPNQVYIRYLDIRTDGCVDYVIKRYDTVKSTSVTDPSDNLIKINL